MIPKNTLWIPYGGWKKPNNRRPVEKKDVNMKRILVKTPRILWIPLFFGGLWGLTEATLGYMFHMIKIPGLPGFLMFPAALFFMVKAYEAGNKVSVVFLSSLVAASFKFLDLMIPPHDLWTVVNPAAAIICESLALILFLSIWEKQKLWDLRSLWSVAVGWKISYGLFLIPLGFLFRGESFLLLESVRLFRFFIVESFLQGLVIYLWIQKYAGFSFMKHYFRRMKENHLG